MKTSTLLFIILILTACQQQSDKSDSKGNSEIIRSFEAITLMGDTLYSASVDSGKAFDNYNLAKEAYEENNDDPDALIWYGRRTAYLGQFQGAIKIYTTGIERFPNDARMYRHRGHRYISTRQYDKAITDFEKATSNTPDRRTRGSSRA
jgi:tetratricopeptide (TPR) repeat protein